MTLNKIKLSIIAFLVFIILISYAFELKYFPYTINISILLAISCSLGIVTGYFASKNLKSPSHIVDRFRQNIVIYLVCLIPFPIIIHSINRNINLKTQDIKIVPLTSFQLDEDTSLIDLAKTKKDYTVYLELDIGLFKKPIVSNNQELLKLRNFNRVELRTNQGILGFRTITHIQDIKLP